MDGLAGASSCRQLARVARAVASAEYWPLVRYPHSLTLSLLDNSSSTRRMIVFTPSSIGEVEDSAKSAYFDRGSGSDQRARRIRRTASISGAAEELRLAPVNPTIFATGHGSVRDEQNLIESRSASVPH